MKNLIRLFIRKILFVREKETISDSLNRKKYIFLKKINHKHFNVEQLKNKIELLGLSKGDTVIVHASWRAFVGFDGSPKDVIDLLLDIVGKDGTVLMPAFSHDKNVFNYNDISCAGVLSEEFRKNYNVVRSLDSTFSMIGYGKKANDLLSNHIKSKYCFDENSPYYLSMQNNSKVLLLGLGSKPHKISIFHCITYSLRNSIDCYKNVYTLNRNVEIYDKDGNVIKKEIINRQSRYQNNKKKFKKLFTECIDNTNRTKINFLDICLFDSKKVFDIGKNYIMKNNYMLYKK